MMLILLYKIFRIHIISGDGDKNIVFVGNIVKVIKRREDWLYEDYNIGRWKW